MNATRLVFCLGCYLWLASIGWAADPLVRRDGQFLNLTTDLESEDEIRQLIQSFDAAVPQWFRFWNLEQSDFSDFQVEACVMRDRSRFQSEGLIPASVPRFPYGYALGKRVWVNAQPSEYYTRHLLLHEGVHSFAFAVFGGAGPTWFQEGIAELLATHAGSGETLQVNRIPRGREEVPYWGRFKRMDQLRTDGQVPTLPSVMRYQPDLQGDVGKYAWSWAASMILQAYPEYRDTLQTAARNGRRSGPGFNRPLRLALDEQWPILTARWRIMCNDLDYGFDWSRERVQLSTKDPSWDGRPFRFTVAANQGWQSCGLRIPRGVRVHLQPGGQVILANTTRPWLSEPSGITFQYQRGRPVGQLLLCVLPNAIDQQQSTVAPLPIQAITAPSVIEVSEYSWLLFRVNDGLDQLEDNQGQFEVLISPQAAQ